MGIYSDIVEENTRSQRRYIKRERPTGVARDALGGSRIIKNMRKIEKRDKRLQLGCMHSN